MNLNDRVIIFEKLFEDLQLTSSRNMKERLVSIFLNDYPELTDDWYMILETLDGKHPLGYTFDYPQLDQYKMTGDYDMDYYHTVQDLIEQLLWPKERRDLSTESIYDTMLMVSGYSDFLAPIVNRTLRLGIGKSLLEKNSLTPMLAKKYENILTEDVAITEKLDGNRCLAYYDGEKWCFQSRNGKPMKVDFDMNDLPTDLIFDGEVMSEEQTKASIKRCRAILFRESILEDYHDGQILFNKTSGLINSHATNKNLVYNIFDIIDDKLSYKERRDMLNKIHPTSNTIRILPVLYVGRDKNRINELLDVITKMKGEGIMLNLLSKPYEHKRTNGLLKYKEVYYIDMKVKYVFEGNGKYEGMCGGLGCEIYTDDGKYISCEVGSGLSDEQRYLFYEKPHLITDKIVEIAYQCLSQDASKIGTKNYSLRFPRLIRVRNDKSETSEY